MNPYRKNQRLLIGAVLATLVAYFLFWWLPHRRRMAELQQQVQQVQQTIRLESARLKGLSDVRAELAKLQSYIAGIERQLPDQIELPRFLSGLYSLAKELGIQTVQTQPQVPSQVVELQTQAVHLTLVGDSAAIARLIYRLETGPRIVELTALQMRTDRRNKAGRIEAEIETRLFAQQSREEKRLEQESPLNRRPTPKGEPTAASGTRSAAATTPLAAS